jgi:hypothetical protein
MTLDGFLTFLGLAAAVFAIIPPVARLRIRLQLVPQAILAGAALERFPIMLDRNHMM